MKLLHKKRGDRSSVPPLAGSLVEALGDAALTLVGSVVLTAVAVDWGFRLIDSRPLPGLWQAALLLLPSLACVAVGLFRLSSLVFRSSLTVERRCALIRRGGDTGMQREGVDEDQRKSLQRSIRSGPMLQPGERLAFRLPLFDDQLRPMAQFGGLALLAGIATAALVSSLAERRFSTSTTVGLSLLLTLTSGGVLWTGWLFARRLIRWYRCGPTCVEVNAIPAIAGTPLVLHVRQCDRARWRSVQVALECHEEAVFHQGTDVRRESRRVLSLPCRLEEAPTTREGRHRDLLGECDIPRRAMPTFIGTNGSIQWRLRITARAKRGIAMEREAPLTIAAAPTAPAPEVRTFRRSGGRVGQEVG